MRRHFLVFCAVGWLWACGGAVTEDHGAAGTGAGAQAGGGGSAGSGGSSGFGSSAGFGGSSGFGGGAGVGGAAGAGGAPFCCSGDSDCPELLGDPPQVMECVQGVCKQAPPDMQCWRDQDCPFNACFGAVVCPCGSALTGCDSPDQPGWCASPPPPSDCCQIDTDCGDYAYVPCVNGVCKQPVPGHCWKNDECPYPQKCVGAGVCPCGAACGVADMPGTCQ